MRLRLLDLDGSVTSQPALCEAIANGGGRVVSLRDLGPRLRLWAGRTAMREFARRLAEADPAAHRGTEVTFIGSGDYHHLCTALLRSEDRITLLHFDNHPDWVRFAPAYHCGSWINRVLRMRRIERIITIGPCSDDLANPQLKGGNVAALAAGRLELYPWQRSPSRVWGRIASGPGHRRRGNRLIWRNVGTEDWQAFVAEILDRMPTDGVWITIDKDVLRSEDAVTNWDQGQMPLTALLTALRMIAARKRLVGVDVCGEYAPLAHRHPLKRWEAWTDQPAAPAGRDVTRNVATNAALLATLAEISA